MNRISLFGWIDAETTADITPQEKGWKFELSSICDVKRHEDIKVVVTYTKKENNI